MFETQEMFTNSVQIIMEIMETLPADFFTVVLHVICQYYK